MVERMGSVHNSYMRPPPCWSSMWEQVPMDWKDMVERMGSVHNSYIRPPPCWSSMWEQDPMDWKDMSGAFTMQ